MMSERKKVAAHLERSVIEGGPTSTQAEQVDDLYRQGNRQVHLKKVLSLSVMTSPGNMTRGLGNPAVLRLRSSLDRAGGCMETSSRGQASLLGLGAVQLVQ